MPHAADTIKRTNDFGRLSLVYDSNLQISSTWRGESRRVDRTGLKVVEGGRGARETLDAIRSRCRNRADEITGEGGYAECNYYRFTYA